MTRNKKVDFEHLKYNLDDLFNNTPVFDIPIIEYSEKTDVRPWEKIASSIFDPFGKINEYVKRVNNSKPQSARKSKMSISPSTKSSMCFSVIMEFSGFDSFTILII